MPEGWQRDAVVPAGQMITSAPSFLGKSSCLGVCLEELREDEGCAARQRDNLLEGDPSTENRACHFQYARDAYGISVSRPGDANY
jgi:hypothetical protein